MNDMNFQPGPGLEEVDVGLVVDAAAVHPPRPGRDWMIATLATMQYGVVSRRQLLAAGIGAGAIETRLKRHQLHPLHRGVYAVGHTALVPLAREMAAVLACGPNARPRGCTNPSRHSGHGSGAHPPGPR